jgi:serine/threonine-protein kinase CTR1
MSEIEKSMSDLKIKQVKITSNSLGAGSFGEVVEAVWINTPCAAKRLHLVFRMLPQKQQPGVVDKFLRECRTWSTLRHPHIVLFLGIVYEPESPLPVLIIEKMDTSLHSFVIDSPKEDFPLYRKGSVFLQVAQALCYLHSQGFVHRDLTPKNILLDLDSFKAKITDFGVTGVVNSTVSRMTSVPGNPAFMPPESSGSAPKYDEKLDTFSYGNVILFSTSGQWPGPEYPVKTVNGKIIALTEYERRAVYVDLMSNEEKKLFLSIITHCLENEPGKRPTSKDLAEEMNQITSQIEVEDSSQATANTESPEPSSQDSADSGITGVTHNVSISNVKDLPQVSIV